jgi:hypothetical protein
MIYYTMRYHMKVANVIDNIYFPSKDKVEAVPLVTK